MDKLKRLIQKFFIIFITLLISFACATTSRISLEDEFISYRDQFVICKNNAIPKYLNKSNNLNLVKNAVMADCGYYLSQMQLVFALNFPYQPMDVHGHWENIVENEIGKTYLLQQNNNAPRDDFQVGLHAYVNRDYQTAFIKLKPFAEQGNAEAQVFIGHMYVNGFGVSKDIEEAVAWYRQSANQGNALGQFNLGVMYGEGAGVIQDYKEAVKWIRLSTEQGNADAQVALGMLYSNGFGVDQDYVEAYKWLSIAGANVDKKGREGREQVEKRMTPDQIAEAQKLAREWMEEHNKN